MSEVEETERTFKTAWFTKAARKARITDDELCEAIRAVRKGQADDLGAGVFKKRLDKNRHRSVILAKGRRFWVYAYLFARRTAPTLMMPNCGHSAILRISMPKSRTIRLSRS